MTLSIKCILVSIALTDVFGMANAEAQSYEETVNYIFNTNKQANSVRYGLGQYDYNVLSNYNANDCTVEIDSGLSTISGKIFLKNIRRWSWRPFMRMETVTNGQLTLESEGKMFEGFYTPNGMRPGMGFTSRKDCYQSCQFNTPREMEMWRLEAAFKHLWKNYCPPEKGNSEF
jgi:hypothetical protein